MLAISFRSATRNLVSASLTLLLSKGLEHLFLPEMPEEEVAYLTVG